MKVGFTLIICAISLGLPACSGAAPPVGSTESARSEPVAVEGGTYVNVSPAELAAILQSQDFLFVNVHIPYEGEIEQTDQFIAFEENGPQRIQDYPADKNAPIVLYCRSGRMSAIVATELIQAGYTNIRNLAGGMIAWESAGYPLIQK